MKAFGLVALALTHFSQPAQALPACAQEFSQCLRAQATVAGSANVCLARREACIAAHPSGTYTGTSDIDPVKPVVVPPVIAAFDPFASAIASDVAKINAQYPSGNPYAGNDNNASISNPGAKERLDRYLARRDLRQVQYDQRLLQRAGFQEQRRDLKAEGNWKEFDALVDAQLKAKQRLFESQQAERSELLLQERAN